MTEHRTPNATPGTRQAALVQLGAAAIYDALGHRGALQADIRPLWMPLSLAGPVFTVNAWPGDNLALHRALTEAPPGTLLAVAAGNSMTAAIWGGLLAAIASHRGLLGLVTDGVVRDRDEIQELGLPVFCRGTSVVRPTKHQPGELGTHIVLGGVALSPGDWIIGDGDGVVAIPADLLDDTLRTAEESAEHEAEVLRRAKLGESTVDILGLPGHAVS
jgi:4-hydroxy-4-methyl-2-oxoglutarate aldolase